MIQFEHFETANDIMIRFSSASILFSVQNQLKLHRKINCRLKKTDHSLNSDWYTATTNIPISWLITMTSCQRSSRLMMPSTLLTSLTKRRKNTVNTISSTMPGTTRQIIWRIGREPLGASRMQKDKTSCWAMMIFWSTTRWNDCNLNISKARAWCELFSFRLVIMKEVKLRKNEEYGLWKFWLLMTIKTSFNY